MVAEYSVALHDMKMNKGLPLILKLPFILYVVWFGDGGPVVQLLLGDLVGIKVNSKINSLLSMFASSVLFTKTNIFMS